jgi:hypothetical protein
VAIQGPRAGPACANSHSQKQPTCVWQEVSVESWLQGVIVPEHAPPDVLHSHAFEGQVLAVVNWLHALGVPVQGTVAPDHVQPYAFVSVHWVLSERALQGVIDPAQAPLHVQP